MAICKIGGLLLHHFSIVFNGTAATAAVASHLRYFTKVKYLMALFGVRFYLNKSWWCLHRRRNIYSV